MAELTNAELLDLAHRTPSTLFTDIEKQRIMLLGLALQKMPCPNCGTLQDQLEAAGIALDEYSFGSEQHDSSCVGCGRGLAVSVPFIAMGPRWHWSLVSDPNQVRS